MSSNDPKDQFDPNTEIGRKKLATIQFARDALADIQTASKIDLFLKELKEILEEKKVFEQEIELQFFLQKAQYNQSMQEYLLSQHLAAERRLQEMGDFLAKQLALLLDMLDQRLQQLDSVIAQIDHKIKELQEERSHAVEDFVEDFKKFLFDLPMPKFESSRDEHNYKVHLAQALYPVLDGFKQGQILPNDLNAQLLIAKNKVDRIFFADTNLSSTQQIQLRTLNANISGYVAPKVAHIQKIDLEIEKQKELRLACYQERNQLAASHSVIKETPAMIKQIEKAPPIKSKELMHKLIEKITTLKADNKIDVKPLNTTQQVLNKIAPNAKLGGQLKADNAPQKVLSVRERILENIKLEKAKLENQVKADNSPPKVLNKKSVEPLTPRERVEAKKVQANEDHQPAVTSSMRRR